MTKRPTTDRTQLYTIDWNLGKMGIGNEHATGANVTMNEMGYEYETMQIGMA